MRRGAAFHPSKACPKKRAKKEEKWPFFFIFFALFSPF